jgi:competence protein ComGC
MKTKHIGLLLVIISVMFLFGTTSAQQFKSPVRTLFEKYEDNSGMNMMYVSKKMFELKFRQKLQGNPDFPEDIIDNFNEMILVGGEDGRAIPSDDMKKLKDDIRDKGYDQIVKMVEDGESLTVYILEDKKTNRIKDLIVMALEDDEQLIMSISGNMTLQEIVTVSRLLDINILNVLHV